MRRWRNQYDTEDDGGGYFWRRAICFEHGRPTFVVCKGGAEIINREENNTWAGCGQHTEVRRGSSAGKRDGTKVHG